ncbi:MAG: translocation/assembly module TamB domain-containing protein [Bacteroidales bacterium]|nr:translocation/assembly module TamB domain-containing protein [Bacteroidales bacterium]
MNNVLSFLKRTLKVVAWVAATFVFLVVLIAGLIQIPAIQNKIVHYAIAFVSDKTHTKVEVKNVSISFPKSVVINGLYVEDLHQDTLLYAGETKINITLTDLIFSKITVNSIALDDLNLNLYNTATDSLFNYNFLLTAFSDTTPKVAPNTPSKWRFSINHVSLKNIRLRYDDEFGGMNMAGSLTKLELQVDQMDVEKSIYRIDKLLVDNLMANVLVSKLSNTKKTSDISPTITANNIQINDASIIYRNVAPKQRMDGAVEPIKLKNVFDADNLQFRQLNLVASQFYFSANKTVVLVKKFSVIDQNNFAITKFETDFSMDNRSITAKRLKAKTTHSSIEGDFNLQFSSFVSLTDSLPLLVVDIDLKNSSIQSSDILYFTPSLHEQPFFANKTNITTASGRVTGRINNLTGENLVVKTGVNTVLETDFTIVGLPDAQKAQYHLPNLTLVSGKQDINRMVGSAMPTTINLPEKIILKVAFNGKITSFKSMIKMKSSDGNAAVLANIDKYENFSAKLTISDFDLGSLLPNKKMYGPVTLTAEVNGHGLDQKTMMANIKAEVSVIYLNNYLYHNLKMDGTLANQQFEGEINLKDENAAFDFDGLVNLIPNQEQFKFQLKVQGADLQKLHFSKDATRLSFDATADLKGGTVTDLNGKAGITNTVILHKGKKYQLDSVFVATINQPNQSALNISSALVGLKYNGTVSPTSLPDVLTKFINSYFPFTADKTPKKRIAPSNFAFEIQLHNHPILSEVLLPELKEFEPGNITGSFDSEKNELKLNANMNKIVYGTTEINNLSVTIHSDSTALNYAISSSTISNAQLKLNQVLLDGKLKDNKITARISSIDNAQNKKLLVQSQITKVGNNFKLEFNPYQLYLMNNRWDIADDNYVEFGKQGFLIHHLFMNNGASQINISSVNDKFNDDLNIRIKNFKLEDISGIIEKDSSIAKGTVDGNVLLKRVNQSYGIIADANITKLFVRNVSIGDLAVKVENPTTQRFNLQAKLSGTENNLTANGYFIPNGGNNSLNINADIQSLAMKTVEAFSMGQVTEASGTVSGNFLINGRTDAPEMIGELTFNNAFLKPTYLNNRLELKHETVQLKTDGIYFNNFTLLDVNQHKAIVDGTVKMKQFSDFMLALHINTQDFLLFNTSVQDNKEYYGRMIVDSKIEIKGPLSLPIITGKMKLKKGSNFTFAVPEDKFTTDKGEDVVEFGDAENLAPILNRKKDKTSAKSGFTGVDLSAIIEVDKEATLKLLMDPTSSDSLVVRGDAALSFTMDRSGKMSLTGAYNLNDGSYLISLEQVIKRKFDIISGSTITWNGDPLDADINLNATYSVRAAPYDLVADQMAGLSDIEKGGYKQMYPFLVMLKLRGAILKPEITFEIQLNPEDKGILGGAVNQKLNLLNEDPSLLNKQVFALLVLGRFVQENPLTTESGVISTLVRSTVGNFLSAQLNQLSSKVVKGVDLNFNVQSYDDYQSGQARGRTQVEIGLKKQLFSDRLTVQLGGSVDVEGTKAKQNSASEITGDVTVEYKLTKDGRYRLKGFRHNQYEGVIEGQLVETGVGVVYVKDFNKWKKFFRKSKKKP